MENSQINEAQNEYEAGLEDSQPTTAPNDYELAQQIGSEEWVMDFGDYLAGDNPGQTLALLVHIRTAIRFCTSESYGVDEMQDTADALLGQLVRRHFICHLRKTKGNHVQDN